MESVPILGGSLPVPIVQELAKQDMINIPARYVRSEQDPPIISDDSKHLPSIPVIDLERLLHEESMPLELEKLHSACKNWGFFQLVNHRVSHDLMEEMKMEAKEFFKRPMEEREKLRQRIDDIEGYGQNFVFSNEQKLDWSDILFLINHPINLRKPHLFENLPRSFRETLECYTLEMQKLAMTIFEQMARALGMEVEEIREVFANGYNGIRMNYYPPCPQPEQVIGFAPHSDSVGLTILIQVTESTDGLQIKHEGAWILVRALPDAFIVNVGDMIEMLSNGVYRSIEHRAIVNSDKERISFATFFNPNLKAKIGPARSLVNRENPPLFKMIEVEQFYREFFTRELKSKSYIDSMRIEKGEK